jgi:uncharacterized membrane protein YbhN (UPF0104 family)
VAVLTVVLPGGLGTRDAALAIALKAVIAATLAIAVAVAFRIFHTLLELLFVACVVWLDRPR